jgi:hypothetical protein
MHNALAIFAARYNITPRDAYVLPALFDHSAAIAKLPVRELVEQATYSNAKLGEYIAKLARIVAEKDRDDCKTFVTDFVAPEDV